MYNEKKQLEIENMMVVIIQNQFLKSYETNTKLHFPILIENRLIELTGNLINLAKHDAIYYIGTKYYKPAIFASEDKDSEELWKYIAAYIFFFADEIETKIISYSTIHGISKSDAFNLIGNQMVSGYTRTMANDIYNQIMLKTYNLAGVENFQFVAVIDARTSDICNFMNGKILNSSNIDAYRPPLHPYCRSRVIPIKREDAYKSDKFSGLPKNMQKTYDWFSSTYSIDISKFKLTLYNIK